MGQLRVNDIQVIRQGVGQLRGAKGEGNRLITQMKINGAHK